jgi:hypothetical protein
MQLTTTRASTDTLRDFVGVVTDRQTYRNLLYLVLAFPLGVLYSMLLTIGFGFGAVLSLVGIGIAILLGTVVAVRGIAVFERSLAEELLGLDLGAPEEVSPTDGLLSRLRAALEAASTWRALGFLLLKLWIGILGIVLLALLATTISLVTVPLRYPHETELIEVNSQPITWTIDTVPEAGLAVVVGALLSIAVLHLTNAFAYVVRQSARALLGSTRP